MSVLESTRIPLDAGGEALSLYKQGPSAAIRFAMEPQCHSNWCWAAVAVSVAAYYDPNSRIRQCELANQELKRTNCCDFECHAPNVDFNVTNVFASPLNRVGCLHSLARFTRATPAEVLEELRAGRPVCVRTLWRDGGAHFVAIVGYWSDTEGTPMLTLDDPFWGPSECSYDRFADDYQLLGGKWNDTYYTKTP